MVITFNNSENAVSAYEVLKNCSHENKKLLGEIILRNYIVERLIMYLLLSVLMLPTVKPHMLPPGVCPLLVFVNSKSGGCQGIQLISSFRRLLNPHQVFDLTNGGPLCG